MSQSKAPASLLARWMALWVPFSLMVTLKWWIFAPLSVLAGFWFCVGMARNEEMAKAYHEQRKSLGAKELF